MPVCVSQFELSKNLSTLSLFLASLAKFVRVCLVRSQFPVPLRDLTFTKTQRRKRPVQDQTRPTICVKKKCNSQNSLLTAQKNIIRAISQCLAMTWFRLVFPCRTE